jgi:hypothetical protein
MLVIYTITGIMFRAAAGTNIYSGEGLPERCLSDPPTTAGRTPPARTLVAGPWLGARRAAPSVPQRWLGPRAAGYKSRARDLCSRTPIAVKSFPRPGFCMENH